MKGVGGVAAAAWRDVFLAANVGWRSEEAWLEEAAMWRRRGGVWAAGVVDSGDGW
jgi:hypothetical protein